LLHVQKGTGRSFVVHAGAARVEVVGTVFGVMLRDGAAAVEVVEGVVELVEGGTRRRLAAGGAWPPGSELFRLTATDLAALRAPLPLPVGAASAAPDTPTATRAEPTASALPSPPPATAVARTPSPASVRPTASSEPARPDVAGSGAKDAENPYQKARELERLGEPEDARAAFAAIAKSGGPNAEDAAFALVRMPAQRADPKAALAAIADYRRAFPQGRYARDVDVHELNAHLALNDEHAALRDADAFLHRFATDTRAWRFRLVRAAGHARAGHCALARTELESVPDGDAKSAVLTGCTER
jgi:hypothetical protein